MTEEGSNESNWFQDNLRIIISVGIVILLVFAIYSYSKRTARTDVVVDDSQIEEIAMTAESENSKEINEILDEIKDEEQEQIEEVTDEQPEESREDAEAVQEQQEAQEKAEQEQKAQDEKQSAEEEAQKIAQAEAEQNQQDQKIAQEQQEAQEKAEQEQKAQDEKQAAEEEAQKIAQAEAETREEQEKQNTQSAKDAMREVIESHSGQTQQKDGVIIVVAIPGDSTTTLARKAAADYISGNNIGGLTPAHKIYIEDYMRKTKDAQDIHPGTELEFSNELINSAIEESRTLTDAQLQNLDRYAQNVSTF